MWPSRNAGTPEPGGRPAHGMDTRTIFRKLRAALRPAAPETGLTPLPFLGLLSCAEAHRLHAVSLPQSSIVFVLQGTKVVGRGAESVTVRAGEAFLFPVRMETVIENVPDPESGLYAALCLAYDEDMIARVSGARPGNGPAHRSLDALCLRCDDTVAASLAHLLDMAAAEPGNERLLALCREELLVLAGERTGCLPLLWDAASAWESRCAALVGLDPGRDWTADALAARLGISERSLRRHLRGEGTGLRDILREVRLGAGLGMLQAGGTTVGETAYRCGYNSASRFAGLFRERFGVSPAEVLRCNADPGRTLAGS